MSVKVQPLFAIEVVTVYMSSELVLRLHKKWSHSQIKQCVYGNKYMSTAVVDPEGPGVQIQADYCNSTHCYIMPGRGCQMHFSFS